MESVAESGLIGKNMMGLPARTACVTLRMYPGGPAAEKSGRGRDWRGTDVAWLVGQSAGWELGDQQLGSVAESGLSVKNRMGLPAANCVCYTEDVPRRIGR